MTDNTGIKTHDPLCYAIDKLWAQEADGSWRCMDCAFIAKVRADERSRIADSVAELMIAHPYEYPSDYAEADREWIKAGCPRDAIDALKEKQ
jgi:hypothetical protein